MGRLDIAGLDALAVDAVAPDDVEDQIGAVGLPLDQAGCERLAQHLADRRDLVEMEGRRAVPGVAAGTALPDPRRFQHDRIDAALAQVQGGGEARIAAADHADARLHPFLKGNGFGSLLCRREP